MVPKSLRCSRPRPAAQHCRGLTWLYAPLQAIVDKLKGVAGDVALVTTKQGDLHLQASTAGLHFGTELRGLEVLPAAVGQAAQPLRCVSLQGR
jgi:hypothetical protein